jgi:hypothetical protein
MLGFFYVPYHQTDSDVLRLVNMSCGSIRTPASACSEFRVHIGPLTVVLSHSYGAASVGVAVASTPCGPYRYLASWKPFGADSRDMGVFVDGAPQYISPEFASDYSPR